MWWIIWLVLAITLLAIDLLLPDPITVWFGMAASVVWLVSLIIPSIPWYWEITMFLVLSIGAVIALPPKRIKPFLKRLKGQSDQETDFEFLLKYTGVVEECINNDLSTGLVKIHGVVWSARSVDNSTIEKGSIVTIQSVNGNKLYVKKKKEEDEMPEITTG